MLDSRDIGHRVVVRRMAGRRDGRPVYSDMLGRLTGLSDSELTVETSDGLVHVPLPEVHRAKRVPDRRRPTARDIASLEIAADAGWPAPTVERLGEWRLRAADGWTGRANSALAVGDPGLPLEEAVDAVARWYAARGAVPLINVPLPYAARLDAVLEARGWPHRPLTLVQTTDVADLARAAPARADLPEVRLAPAPSQAWLAVAGARKGGLPAAALHILTAVDQVRFAEVYDDGALLASARGAVTAGWLGLSLIEVAPWARRRGLGQHVTGALARWAATVGARRVYLQVEERNAPAVALYARLGFTTHHHYLSRWCSLRSHGPGAC